MSSATNSASKASNKRKSDAKDEGKEAKKVKGGCPYREARTDGPLKCTWFPGTTETNPHISRPKQPRKLIMDSILDNIGNTPLVRLNRLTGKEGIKAEILAKCEFFNAGGSVKDRIGYRMIVDAEASGRIKPGDTLIEPTSGNTGIGLALAAALKGYRMIITLPEKMSEEKVNVLKALGAEIIRTPTEAAYDSPESHIGVAKRLNAEIPNSHILDQYANPSNPLAHYEGTAEELIEQCADQKIDAVVMSAGTGGTITGVARRLKEVYPDIIVVGVDPKGSILAEPDNLNNEKRLQSYQVEGIGYDFIPTVLDRSIIDRWIKTDDKESFIMSRRLIREEGLLCGGSCGSTMVAAVQVAREMGAGKRVVALLADSTRNYMTKFLKDEWMYANGFVSEEEARRQTKDTWWTNKFVSDLNLSTPFTVQPTVTCKEAVDILNANGFDQLPIVSAENEILGVVTEGNLSAKLIAERIKGSDPVTMGIYPKYKVVSLTTKLGDLARIFDHEHFALVVTSQKCYLGHGETTEKKLIYGVVSRIDLLKFISQGPAASTTTTPKTVPKK